MRKIFCLGFGCTGTNTLHATAQATGLRCLHDGIWARTTLDEIFFTFAETYNRVPPPNYPGVEAFCRYEDWDFFSDGHHSNFELLDSLFPDSYFILNTRSKYNWLTSMYNHLQRNRSDPDYNDNWLDEPTAEYLHERMRARLGYHHRILTYFKQRDNFAVVDVEAQEESEVCEVLQTATGKPVECLHISNIHKTDAHYEPNPQVVKEALELCDIPRERWHVALP